MKRLKFDPTRQYHLDEINYFSSTKITHKDAAILAESAVILSRQSIKDNLEINKKIYKVLCANGEEEIRQYINLLCELIAYNEIKKLEFSPHWVEEINNIKTPDIEYTDNGKIYLAEVKHINRPREEDLALRTGGMYEIDTDHFYDVYLAKQIKDKINESINKQNEHKATLEGVVSEKVILYLFITPALTPSLLGDLDFRVQRIIDENNDETIDIRFINFQKYFETPESIKRTEEINKRFHKEIIRQFRK